MSKRDYKPVSQTIASLCEGETDAISKMATISCELFHAFDGFDWVGFYRVTEPRLLKIGPYQGTHGCLVIPFDKGVCGACARTQTTQLVGDVSTFPGHIACSATTRSEIVLPVLKSDKLIAVLDIDSNLPDHFDDDDRKALEHIIANSF